ncbi:TonB-linked SusC/RagA family outer membrane protein [Larkinella arboricola]|uniref:TonB-linked SusC/RagA family outer membrane protein n=1 Tax=Larkinella arboricola TaxID=643671 RepID=A0A327X5A7_LARAB|nr:TonB-dependent receptor [Larkinella arboricola]RAK02280.1 TonB-linked SusC/RagA family outer membrane protein [Larkinella arboricola]
MKRKNFYQPGPAFILLIALVLSTFGQLAAQDTREIQGTVREKVGQAPMPGVNVVIKGTSRGTSTNAEGQFSISAKPSDVLIFSFIGYVSQEIAVGNQTTINMELNADVQALNEIVVTGYSAQRKKDITGSVAIVDMKAVKSVPAGSAVQALQGQASGVNVISSGVPGANSRIFVRGVTSFGDTQPLVIVDGIQADLNNISADDVESIQVLKDAGAAAIYGVRGANGVIVVTTKKGKSGRPTVTYDAYYGTQRPLPGNPFDLLNAQDFMKVVQIATPNNPIFANGMPDYLYAGPGVAGVAKAGDPAVDPAKYSFDPINTANNYLIQRVNQTGTDWFHELFKPAPMTNHTLTASGGTDKSNYLFSVNYISQQGTLIETYLKRYSARINTGFKIGDHIRIGENANVYYRQSPSFGNQAEFGNLSAVYKMMPIIPVYDIMGNYGGTFAGPSLGSNQNPVAMQQRTRNNRDHSWNIVGNMYAEVDFLKHFTARTSFGGTVANGYNQSFNFTQYDNKQGNSSPNSYSESSSYSSTIMWTNTLNYSNLFGKHNLQVLAGSEIVKNTGRGVGGSSQAFFATDYNYLVLGNGTAGVTNFSNAFVNSLYSLFARVDYAFDDKYLVGATVRRDGSSRFGSDMRFGVFPSVSLGWRVTGERFMKDILWLNELKVRGSYGVLGSQNNVSPENAFSLYGGGYGNAYYDIGGTSNSVRQGFIQTRIGNSRTGWEENVVSNIGFDATLLNNKLDLSVEYYRKSINGLLFTQPLPATVGGATAPVVNIGDIRNTGLDASVTFRGRITSDLQFSVGTNITTYKNVAVDIPTPGYFDVASLQGMGTLVRNQKGQPVSSFFGYDVLGLFNSEQEVAEAPAQSGAAPGRFRYRDVNGDGAITPEDRTFLGSPNPDFTYGLNLGLNYKGFDFSTIFYGSQGNEIVNTIRSYTHFYAGYIGNKSNVLLNAWTPENTNTTVPKIETGTSLSTSGALNSYFVEDGSYLRLRSLILGYTLKPSVLQKVGIPKLRVYGQATNLFTITKYTGLDPELGGSSSNFGIDYGNYPNNQRTFLLGVNLSF